MRLTEIFKRAIDAGSVAVKMQIYLLNQIIVLVEYQGLTTTSRVAFKTMHNRN
jgi:hypothetical protein